jgi:hypothetical protein
MRGVGGRLAAQRNRREAQRLRPDYLEFVAGMGRQPVPVHGAVVLQDVEQRIAGRQVLVDHVGAVDLKRRPFPQHQQTGRVIDLRVHQYHRTHRGITDGPGGLQAGEAAELGQEIGGRIEQRPIEVVSGNRDGGLGSCLCADRSLAQAVAVGAVAVPLWEAAAGG